MNNIPCTIYDCEFDLYHKGLIKDNIVYSLDDEGNPVPPREHICEYVDFGRVQFYIGHCNIHYAESGEDDSKWGYLQYSTGRIVVPPIYDYAAPFYGNRACVKKNKKYGFIDPEGREIVETIWDDTAGNFRGNLCWVKEGEEFGYIDKNGTIVIPLQFDTAEQFQSFRKDNQEDCKYAALVKKDGKYGYIDQMGNYIFELVFDTAEQFHSISKNNCGDYNYAAIVKRDGKYGYINENGNYIFEPSFEDAKEFWSVGYAPVKYGRWSFIDRSGEFVVAFQFDEIGESGNFSTKKIINEEKVRYGAEYIDFYTVKKDGQWGVMIDNFDIIMVEDDLHYVVYRDMRIYIKNGRVTSMRKLKIKKD